MLLASPQKSKKNRTETTALLGEGSFLEGKFNFEGTGRIDGSFKGEIESKDILIVGQSAKIEAEITVGKLIVEGEIRGNIEVIDELIIHSTGKIYGNIVSPALIIEKGAIFEGNSSMSKIKDKNILPPSKKDKKK